MATRFHDIYNMFLNQITTSEFAGLSEKDFDDILQQHLLSALLIVQESMTDVMDVDLENKQFNNDLHLAEQIILAKAMKLAWLRKHKHSEDLMRQQVSDRDYKIESGAVYLKNLGEQEQALAKEIRIDLVKFSYSRAEFTSGLLGN